MIGDYSNDKAKRSDYDTVTTDRSRKAAAVKKIESDSRNSGIEGLQGWLRVRRDAVGTLNEGFKEEQELTASLAQDPVDADLGESLFQYKLNSGR
jgi:hypothetical protein